MASYMRRFTLRQERLQRALLKGFSLEGESVVSQEGEGVHALALRHLDSGEADCRWGRLHFSAEIEADTVLIVRAFASNQLTFLANGVETEFDDFLTGPDIPLGDKEKLFVAAQAAKVTGSRDVLLYGQTGRYLWIMIQVLGASRARISGLQVENPGDNFLQTFPEIYRSEGQFFHRYLSVFSSLYNDLQDTIDSLADLVNIDTAPPGLLPAYQEWLGIHLDGDFLEEKHLRRLLREAFPLICSKGTRAAVERIVRIFVEEPFYIVEQHKAMESAVGKDREVQDMLYGSNSFGYAVLLNRAADELLHARLRILLEQFGPIRCKARIVFLKETQSVDLGSYLDVNACLVQSQGGGLDTGIALTGMLYLQ